VGRFQRANCPGRQNAGALQTLQGPNQTAADSTLQQGRIGTVPSGERRHIASGDIAPGPGGRSPVAVVPRLVPSAREESGLTWHSSKLDSLIAVSCDSAE